MSGISNHLREARNRKGLTQRQLAAQLNISPSTIALYETGDRNPDPSMLNRIADALGCSADYLLGRTNNLEPSILPAPWMDKLKPETRAHLEAVGGLRGFHTRFLGGKGLNDLAPETLEIIMESYFEHLEREAAAAKKAKEGKMDGDD